MGDDLIDRAVNVITKLKGEKQFESDNQLAIYLGINSAFIYHLMKHGNLRPTLYRALIDQGLLPKPPPTINMPVTTAALMFAVAKFPKKRKPKKSTAPRAPRLSIQRENPDLAAKSILKSMNNNDVQQLIDFLIEGNKNIGD